MKPGGVIVSVVGMLDAEVVKARGIRFERVSSVPSGEQLGVFASHAGRKKLRPHVQTIYPLAASSAGPGGEPGGTRPREAGPGSVSVAQLERSVFTTPDGADISVRSRRGGKTLVLIHGLGCDASMWDAVVAALPSDVGLVIPELRGHGDSTLGWRQPSVDVWADDVVRLLRQRRIEAPAIAGLSMGGYTALGIAAAHPGFARAFAFISTAATADDEAGKHAPRGGDRDDPSRGLDGVCRPR